MMEVEELMNYYEKFIDIVEQISMDACQQIDKLSGTVVADELATDFCEIGMIYAKELFANEWISEEQFLSAKDIENKLETMSNNKELWSEEALFNSEEWEICREKGRELLSTFS